MPPAACKCPCSCCIERLDHVYVALQLDALNMPASFLDRQVNYGFSVSFRELMSLLRALPSDHELVCACYCTRHACHAWLACMSRPACTEFAVTHYLALCVDAVMPCCCVSQGGEKKRNEILQLAVLEVNHAPLYRWS